MKHIMIIFEDDKMSRFIRLKLWKNGWELGWASRWRIIFTHELMLFWYQILNSVKVFGMCWRRLY